MEGYELSWAILTRRDKNGQTDKRSLCSTLPKAATKTPLGPAQSLFGISDCNHTNIIISWIYWFYNGKLQRLLLAPGVLPGVESGSGRARASRGHKKGGGPLVAASLGGTSEPADMGVNGSGLHGLPFTFVRIPHNLRGNNREKPDSAVRKT